MDTTETSTWVYEVKPPFPWRNIPGIVLIVVAGLYIIFNTTFDETQGFLRAAGFTVTPLALIFGAIIMYHFFRSRLVVQMDEHGLRAKAPKVDVNIAWADVTNWALDPKLRGVVIACGEERTRIMTPSGDPDERMEIIADAINSRMATFRGDAKRDLGPIEGVRVFVDAREARNFDFDK